MLTTDHYSLPYPSPDLPPDGPDAFRQLAEGVDTVLPLPGGTAYTPQLRRVNGAAVPSSAAAGVHYRIGPLVYVVGTITSTNAQTDVEVTLPLPASDFCWLALKPTAHPATDAQLDGRTTPGSNALIFMAHTQGWRGVSAGAVLRWSGWYTTADGFSLPEPGVLPAPEVPTNPDPAP